MLLNFLVCLPSISCVVPLVYTTAYPFVSLLKPFIFPPLRRCYNVFFSLEKLECYAILCIFILLALSLPYPYC